MGLCWILLELWFKRELLLKNRTCCCMIFHVGLFRLSLWWS